MGKPSHTTADVERLLDELRCFSCRYPLRGLTGEVVTCPECGRSHNVANMVANEWHGRWYRAPGFNLLALPLLVPCAWAIILAACGIALQDNVELLRLIMLISTIVAIIAWLVATAIVVDRFGQRIAVLVTLMIQSVFPLYLVGAWCLLAVLIMLLLLTGPERAPPLITAGLAGAGIGAIAASSVLQRLAAKWCVRLHVRRLSDAATTPTTDPDN